MTRTDAIKRSIFELLEQMRPQLDAADDIRGLTIDMKFSPEHLAPRTVIDRVERERRKASRAGGASAQL